MIKLVKSDPPTFEFEVECNGQKRIITADALFWNEYDADARNDLLQTAIARYDDYKNLNQWLFCFEFQKLSDQALSEKADFATVRLSQCAGIVNRSKRTLERWKTSDPAFPTPDVIGLDGKPDEWKWSNIRPYLASKLNRELPERFPTLSR